MKQPLNIQTALGCANILLNEQLVDAAKSLGCTETEWKLLTGSRPWFGSDRAVIKRLLDNLLHGMLHTMGLPPLDLPAEYAASCICLFVNPCNYFSACSWMGNFHRADELGNFDGSHVGPTDGLERVSARQLFALVCTLHSEEHIHVIAKRFADKFSVQLGLITEMTNEKEIKHQKK